MLTLFWKSNLAFVTLSFLPLLELSCDKADGDYFILGGTCATRVPVLISPRTHRR